MMKCRRESKYKRMVEDYRSIIEDLAGVIKELKIEIEELEAKKIKYNIVLKELDRILTKNNC